MPRNDKQGASQQTLRENIRLVFKKSAEKPTYEGFATRTGLGQNVVENIFSERSRITYNQTVPVEEAFKLRCNSLHWETDKFKSYLEDAHTELFLLAPEAVAKSWSETKAFAEALKGSRSLFLYYWSHEDRAIIGNECTISFSEDTGIKFSFLNPEHEERAPGAPKKRDHRFSGRCAAMGSTITFEVYSDERDPEPALGIGRYNVPNAPEIAQGRIIGFQTGDDHIKHFAFFRFILLSDPQPAADLQLTDRICVKRLSAPLAKFFADELRCHPHICGRHPQTCD